MANDGWRLFRRTSAFGYTVITREERHEIDFHCDQFNGRVSIRVDGAQVVEESLPHMSLSLTRTFAFDIGTVEEHRVTIEMTRRLALAGLRPLRYRLLVDGAHVTSFER